MPKNATKPESHELKKANTPNKPAGGKSSKKQLRSMEGIFWRKHQSCWRTGAHSVTSWKEMALSFLSVYLTQTKWTYTKHTLSVFVQVHLVWVKFYLKPREFLHVSMISVCLCCMKHQICWRIRLHSAASWKEMAFILSLSLCWMKCQICWRIWAHRATSLEMASS